MAGYLYSSSRRPPRRARKPRSSRFTSAAAVRIADSPAPIAYAATLSEGASRAPSGQGQTNVCGADRAGASFGVSRPPTFGGDDGRDRGSDREAIAGGTSSVLGGRAGRRRDRVQSSAG